MMARAQHRFGARAQTIALAAVVLALLAVVVVFALTSRSSHPTTEKGVRAEVTEVIDLIENNLPSTAILSSTDVVETEPCPTGDGVRYPIARTVLLDQANFDQTEWMRDIGALFDKDDGWDVRLTTASDQSRLAVKIVNRALIVWEIASSTEARTIVMSSTSRCTAPAG